MKVAGKRQFRDIRGVLIFFLVGGFLFLQSSCVTPDDALSKLKSAFKVEEPAKGKKTTKKQEPAKTKKTTKPVASRPGEYVVHTLQRGETPATLAEEFLGDAARSWVIEDANEGIRFKKGQPIVIPLKEKNKGGLARDGYQVVPILVYHHFAEKCRSPLCMPNHIFARQMKYLHDHGYRVITLGELLGFLQYRYAVPKRSVVITIDDGYKSAYEVAYPILRKYGFRATLFIYTDFVGSSRSAITFSQLRKMKADGFEIGSHTLSHCDLKRKKKGESDKVYMARIKKELTLSKKIIDRELGQNTRYLSLPYGKYNHKILSMSKQTGYKMALTVARGGNPFFADPLLLKRDQVLKRDMKTFASLLRTFKKISLK